MLELASQISVFFQGRKWSLVKLKVMHSGRARAYIECWNLVIFLQSPSGKPVSNRLILKMLIQVVFTIMYLHSNSGTFVGKNDSILVSSEDRSRWLKDVVRCSKVLVTVRFSPVCFQHSGPTGVTTRLSSSIENISFKSVAECWLLDSILGT